VDIKPENMEELQEVITCAEFHPVLCNEFIYSTTKGIIRVCDLRASAICDRNAKGTRVFSFFLSSFSFFLSFFFSFSFFLSFFLSSSSSSSSSSTSSSSSSLVFRYFPIDCVSFVEFVDPNKGTIDFFSELVSTISEVKFSPNGYFFASRDYLNIKLWDIRKETGPYKTIKFHEHLLPCLSELYENDSIFDKFQFSWSGDSLYGFSVLFFYFLISFSLFVSNLIFRQVLTGSYNGNFFVCDTLSADQTITKVTLLKSNTGNFQGV
jgi:hypothetical protein